jgi:hypothetical protein
MKTTTPATEGQAFVAILNRAAATPMRIEDGENAAFRAKVQHTMLKDESCLEYCARTGLGPAQAQFMTAAEITSFVDAAMLRRSQDPIELNGAFSRKLEIPKHFTL